jgi:hypothetical protein
MSMIFSPEAIREEILAPDPRYPQWRYGCQKMFKLLDTQDALLRRNFAQPLMQLHAGETVGVAWAQEESW